MHPNLEMSIVIFIYMTLIFVLAQLLKDNSIVDIYWGLGFILVAGYSLLSGPSFNLHKILMNLAVTIWGLRLSIHILLRAVRRGGEDFRYKAWRDTWKNFRLRSFLQIFMLQGLFMLIIALPVYYVNYKLPVELAPVNYLGIILFITGFIFEALGDFQLKVFIKKPENKGKLMSTGLWSITRHPNYFGESLIWWGISMFALNYRYGWITLLSPIFLTLLLRFVSGVPMLESKYKGRPDWEEYKKKTAAFVPFLKFL
jgi:steroid 5-alpha reductase family enzyme